MSQTVTGDNERVGMASQSLNKQFQPSTQVHPSGGFAPNHFFEGQNGYQYNPMAPYPTKSANTNSLYGFQPSPQMPATMQVGSIPYQHHHPQFDQQQQYYMQRMNVVDVRNDVNKSAPGHNVGNPCDNIQYAPGGNFLTTLALHPRNQYGHQQVHQNQLNHPNNQQFFPNQQKYFMNHSMINQVNNMNQFQNVMPSGYKNAPFAVNEMPPNNVLNANQQFVGCAPNEVNDSFENVRSNADNSKIFVESFSNSDASCSSEASCQHQCINNTKVKNNSNCPSPKSKHSSGSSTSDIATNSNHPRSNSHCEPDRSETSESNPNGLNTESVAEQEPIIQHHCDQPYVYNNQNPNANNHFFVNGQLQNVNNAANMNQPSFPGCQPKMNPGPMKQEVHCNPNLVQSFHQVNTLQQVHMQSGQVQIMQQQQYQYVQGQGNPVNNRTKMNVGVYPNANTQPGLHNSFPVGNQSVVSSQSPSGSESAGEDNSQECKPPPSLPQSVCAINTQGPFVQQPICPNMVGSEQVVFPPHNMTVLPNSGYLASMNASSDPSNSAINVNQTAFPTIVVVPFGWKRVNENGQIVYVSPSGTELRNHCEVTEYLTKDGTCKCGLQCPLRVESAFCYDPKMPHRMTMPNEVSSNEMTKLCNHRRKLAFAFSHHLQKQAKKEDGRKKRKRKTSETVETATATPPPSTQLMTQPFLCHPPPQQPVQLQPMRQRFMPYQHHLHPQQLVSNSQMPPHNWNTMNNPRMMAPTGCATDSAGNNYPPIYPPSQYPVQHGCCDNHGCYHNTQPMPCPNHIPTKLIKAPDMHQQFCPPVGNPAFRGAPMADANCMPQQHMQHFQQQQQLMNNYNLMRGNRPGAPYIANAPMCRMPFSQSTGSENMMPSMPFSDAMPTPVEQNPKDGEKKRKNAGRAKKRAKSKSTENVLPANVAYSTQPAPCIASTAANNSQIDNSGPSAQCQNSQQAPSFMEDPNAYLAQQTALLNNTMAGGGVGQFSPQGPKISSRSLNASCSTENKNAVPLSPKNVVASKVNLFPTSKNPSSSHSSQTIVPLPSNVPLPARVNKASSLSPVTTTESAVTTPTNTSSGSMCTSVQSTKSRCAIDAGPSAKAVSSDVGSIARSTVDGISNISRSGIACSVTTTTTITSCESNSNSPQSSVESSSVVAQPCETSVPYSSNDSPNSSNNLNKQSDSGTDKTKGLPSRMSCYTEWNTNKKNFSTSPLSMEAAANKPLTPGPAEPSLNTKSPLEMVQNIVSSIPLPASEEMTSSHGRQYSQQYTPDHNASLQHTVSQPHHQIVGPHVFNVTGPPNSLSGVMYNQATGSSNMIRNSAPLVVHGTASAASIPPGVLVNSSSNDMVVVTSPFNSKSNVTTPVVCSSIAGVVGVQAMPHVQVQSSLAHAQSHAMQPHLQQMQPVQPVVQLVNTFATMQGPVIIQNGGNILQPPAGVLSTHGGVLGTAGIIPTSGPAFVTSQPILSAAAAIAVDAPHSSSHLSVPQGVSSASSDISDDSLTGNRLTPVATPATTPTTPQTTPGSAHGSETPPSSGSSSVNYSGGKRKRKRRNASTPQNLRPQPRQPSGLVPTIILGKQLPQPMVMNGAQISPYGNVTGTQMATMSTVGNSNGTRTTGNHMIQSTNHQPAGAINVVQMVGGPMTGTLPVHVQQPPTILLPAAAPSGLIINQLPDGSFVSTDPTTGVSYPVQLQISGSHIVGVSPTSNTNHAGVLGPITAPAATAANTMMTVNAVRPSTSQPNTLVTATTKVINISPNIQSSSGSSLLNDIYCVPKHSNVDQAINDAICTQTNLSPTYVHSLPQQQPLTHPLDQQRAMIVNNGNATVLQQKTTIVAQQTTVVATQGDMAAGTHSSVSTQTPGGAFGESDVTSSDCAGHPAPERELSTSPTHQSAEITTTKQDEDSISPPESLSATPTQDLSHNKRIIPPGNAYSQAGVNEEPHSAGLTGWW